MKIETNFDFIAPFFLSDILERLIVALECRDNLLEEYSHLHGRFYPIRMKNIRLMLDYIENLIISELKCLTNDELARRAELEFGTADFKEVIKVARYENAPTNLVHRANYELNWPYGQQNFKNVSEFYVKAWVLSKEFRLDKCTLIQRKEVRIG